MGNETSSEYCGYRVLSVQKNSPGYEAGLDPYFDFVVAANNVQLLSEDNEFLDIIAAHAGKDLELIVYNSKRDETRMCTITPRNDWGGQGLLGITIRSDSFENANENVIHILSVSQVPQRHWLVLKRMTTTYSERPRWSFTTWRNLHCASKRTSITRFRYMSTAHLQMQYGL